MPMILKNRKYKLHAYLLSITIFLLGVHENIYSQFLFAEGLPGCVQISDKVGVSCGGGATDFNVIGDRFKVQNIDGAVCCSSGGDSNSFFEFSTVDISNFSNIKISLNYSSELLSGTFEDSISGPYFGCVGNVFIDGGHDQIVFHYSVDGGPFILDKYVHGTTVADFTGTWITSSNINGNTLKIRVYASNKASSEIFYFQNLIIEGTPKLNAGPNQTVCFGDIVHLNATGNGKWIGGLGTFGDRNQAVTTYIPSSSEKEDVVTLTFKANPVFPFCASIEDDVDLNVKIGPEAELESPIDPICTSGCDDAYIYVSEPGTYEYSLIFSAANFTPFTFSVFGAPNTALERINICRENIPFISYSNGKLSIPNSAPAGNYILQLTNFKNTNAVLCPVGSILIANSTIKISGAPNATATELTSCDTNNDDFEAFNLNSARHIVNNNTSNSVEWYVDSLANILVPNPANHISQSSTVFAKITDNNSLCDTIVRVNLIVKKNDPITIQDTTICKNINTLLLPTVMNGISGNWSGNFVTNNVFSTVGLSSGLYEITYNPLAGQCATSGNRKILVQGGFKPIRPSFQPLCVSGPSLSLPTELIGFTGNWGNNVQVINNVFIPNNQSGNFNIIFTPDSLCVDTVHAQVLIKARTSLSEPIFDTICLTQNPVLLPDTIDSIPLIWRFGSDTISSIVPNLYGMGDHQIDYIPDVNHCVLPGNIDISIQNFSAGNDSSVVLCGSSAGIIDLTKYRSSLSSSSGIWKHADSLVAEPTNFNLVTLVPGVHKFLYIISDSICGIDTAIITFTLQSDNNAGNNGVLSVCQSSSSSINFTSILGTHDPLGTWSSTPPSNINFSNLSNVNLSELSSGTYTFKYKVGNNLCPPDSAVIVININAFKGAGPDIESVVCQNEDLDLLALISSEYVGGTIINQNGYSGFNGWIWSPNGFALGKYHFLYRVSGISGCPADTAKIVVNVEKINNAGISRTVTFCQSTTSSINFSNLLGLYDSGGVWSSSTSSSINFANLNSVDLSSLPPATYTFKYKVSNNLCAPDSAIITVHINAFKGAGPDLETSVCQSDSINLMANISLQFAGGTILNPNAYTGFNGQTWKPFGTMAGKYNFNYTVAGATGCPSDTAIISVNIDKDNLAGNDGTITVCESTSSSVDFNVILGTHDSSGVWTSTPSSSINFANLNSVDLSSLPPATYTFKYKVGNNLCAPDSAIVIVHINAFKDAGPDIVGSKCSGEIIDLSSLLTNNTTGGTFSNPNNVPGITGNVWNTSGLSEGMYTILYIVNNSVPCLNDTAKITIQLQNKTKAGNDQTGGRYCQGSTIQLNSYLPSDASPAGKFFINELEIVNGVFNTDQLSSFTFVYKTGVGGACPLDSSLVTLSRQDKPDVRLFPVADICDGNCQNFTINHTLTIGSTLFLRLISSQGSIRQDTIITKEVNSVFSICTDQSGNYNFNKLPLGDRYEIELYKVFDNSSSCVFDYDIKDTFDTRILPNRKITSSLCRGENLVIGNDTYDVNKTSGQTRIPTMDLFSCDSLITVELTIKELSPITLLQFNTCYEMYSVKVGDSLFNKNFPSGIVTLKNSAGCDSSVSIKINFANNSIGKLEETTCDTNKIYSVGNQTFTKNNPTGTVTLTQGAINTCDSIINVNIKYLTPSVRSIVQKVCDDNYDLTVGGKLFNKNTPTGTVILAGGATNGCDSIINVSLEYLSKAIANVDISTCNSNFSYNIGSQIFNKSKPSGTVILPNMATNGCDSIINVSLDFSDFRFVQTLNYNCDGSDAAISISFTTHPGPFIINVDNDPSITIPNLPFNTTLKPGNHLVKVSTSLGCKDSVNINVDQNLGPTVTVDKSKSTDGKTILSVLAPANVIYGLSWSPPDYLSCLDCLDPIANPLQMTTYTLKYLYGKSCPDSVTVIVDRFAAEFVLPNIFSPNNDGINDIFYIDIPASGSIIRKFSIYDRWGNTMFSITDAPVNDPTFGWNGTVNGQYVESGIYVYLVELLLSGQDVPIRQTGSITLTR